ncbi:DUF6482 family protein [Lacimicrobium sp. SS2-24]|uniref:DUF6482 family protein n=1 Tax=Lacimicrobium sp. SS2-24 TaxID=2005569 RepID=UPI000B4B3E76|nr:DUF6482 family protein [Lacimicrobium sp. SS2-24]
MNYQLTSLQRDKPVFEQVWVLSYEMSVYLVQISVDGNRGLVYANDSNPMRFTSLEQVRNAFSDLVVKQAELIHHSAYDEMIGAAQEPDNTMRLPIRLGLEHSL